MDVRVHYGKAFVEIPADYLEKMRTKSWLDRLLLRAPESSLRVRNLVPFTAADFLLDLGEELSKTPQDERYLLVYLHGFQTTFNEAAQRAAGIGYQLKVPNTAFFSWPSKGTVPGYEADKNSVDASSDELAEFLITMVRRTGAKKVHVIAHSMGNYALLQAMYRPVMQRAIQTGFRFGQIILAAPDVDKRVFVRDAALYTRVADRVTMYASSGDVALTASRKLADFPRAGLLPPPTIVQGVDTLDVSSVNLTVLGHSFVADEISVLEDMNKLIFHNEPPAKRTRVLRDPSGSHWMLR